MSLPLLTSRPALEERPEPTSASVDGGRDAPPAPDGGLGRLVAAGLLFELLLILSFVPAPLVPLTADSGMDELLPWLELLGQPIHEKLALLSPWGGLTSVATTLQVACFLALFLPYLGALRWLQRRADAAAGRLVLLFGLLFTLTALCSRRLFSKDLFSYLLNGRIMTVHGGNPYVDVPARFPQDPYLPLVDWREVPNFYGPLWTLISAAVSALGGEELGLTLLLFRLVPAIATGCAALLIWRLLRRARPAEAALGVALWAWNPLVIFEGAGNGHNDALLALFLVAAVGALVGRRPALGLVALALATLVKYSAAVLAPLYLVVLLRRARGRSERYGILVGLAACGLLAAAVFSPFALSGGTLAVSALISSPTRYLNSPTELVFAQARLWLGDDAGLVVERMEYRPWWAATRTATTLLLHRGEIPIAQLSAGRAVLAINRSDGTWQRVYDPASGEAGYVALTALRSTPRPSDLQPDPQVATYERGPAGSAVAGQVNLVVRAIGWLVVLAVLAALLQSASTPDDLLRGWLLLLTLVYWLVATWFFPWYLIWALAVAALRPRGVLVWALVAWSAAVMTYYGIVTLETDPRLGWLYRWRVVPMFLPPLLVLGWHLLDRRLARRSQKPETRSPERAKPLAPHYRRAPRSSRGS